MGKPSKGLKLILAVLFVFAVLGVGLTQDAPTKMTHAIVQKRAQILLPIPFQRSRRVSGVLRIGTAGSMKSRIQPETLTAEWLSMKPDAWLVNPLADNNAKPLPDSGPTFNCRLPICAFDPETPRSKIGELEVGKADLFAKPVGVTIEDIKNRSRSELLVFEGWGTRIEEYFPKHQRPASQPALYTKRKSGTTSWGRWRPWLLWRRGILRLSWL
jgi:hypothetical protein